MTPFVVKHYSNEERPCLKGNGFDGLEIGSNREEAEEFVARINELIAACQAVNCFYTFFTSLIPPGFGKGAKESLQMINAALRLDGKGR